jgi:predicted dehydrogenase
MRWLVNDEVIEVGGMGNKVLTRDTGYGFDDTFISLLRFSRGALGKCLSTYGPRRTKFHSLNVYGTSKTFVNDIPHGKLFTGDQPEDETAILTPYPGMKKGDLIPEFVDAIRAGKEPNVNAKDVFRVMDICFAAIEAAQSGRNIEVSYQI